MIKNESEVRIFLAKHRNPKVTIATTVKEGFVSCIKPVPTICGAELICNQSAKQELMDIFST